MTARTILEIENRIFAGTAKLDFPELRETGGPTYLALGAVPDGYLLQRSGVSLVGVAPSSDLHPQYLLIDGTRAMTGQLLLADTGWAFANATDTKWTHTGFGAARFDVGGSSRLAFSLTQTSFPNTLVVDVSGARFTDGNGRLIIGASSPASGHSLAAGDTHVVGALEIDGVIWADGGMVSASGVEAPRFGASSALLRIGDTSPASGHGLGAGDVLFPGAVEIDGALWADAGGTFAGDWSAAATNGPMLENAGATGTTQR